MRGSTALLVAGTLSLIAGLAGPTLAADEPPRDAPAAEVAAPGSDAPTEPLEPATTTGEETTTPAEDAGRDEPEVDVEEVAEDDVDGERGEDGRDRDRDGRGKGKSKGGGGGEKQPKADVGVTIEDFEYKPDPIEVEPGDEITWTNRDTAQHTATAEGKGDFDTGLLEKGEKGTVPFNETGTFAYICTVHPDMKGEVVVRDASSNADSGGTSGSNSSSGTFPSSGSGSSFPSTSSGSDFGGSSGGGGSGSLPNTGQNELPLLLLGAGLIVAGLLARAFHEYWIWR